MNINKYTREGTGGRRSPRSSSPSEMDHPQIEPEHLLVALLEQPEGVVPGAGAEDGRRPGGARGERGAELLAQDAAGVRRLAAGRSRRGCALVADMAQAEAERLKDEYVSTEHLLRRRRRRDRPLPRRQAAGGARRDAGPIFRR